MYRYNFGRFCSQVTATDADKGNNGEIVYASMPGDHSDHFQLNQATGKITTSKTLDFETIKDYSFTVTASDKGVPSIKSTTKVSLKFVSLYFFPVAIIKKFVQLMLHFYWLKSP